MKSRKNAKQSSSSTKQTNHGRATRVGRKRTRAHEENGNSSAASDSAVERQVREGSTEQTVCTTSRLKKKCIKGVEQSALQPVKVVSGSSDEAEDVSNAIQSLSARCEQFMQLSVKNRTILRPSLELLKQAVEVLRKASAVGVLASAVSLPKILFIAARKGVDNDEQPLRANKMLVESLLRLAKIQNEDLPENTIIGRRRRSAFADQTLNGYSEADIETARRAAEWALQLLSQSIRGTPGLDEELAPENMTDAFEHRDVSEVFVVPRDRLDPLASQRMTERILGALQGLNSGEQHQGRKLDVTNTQMSAVLRSPTCVVLLNQMLLTASHRYVSNLKRAFARESHEFICNIGRDVIRAGEPLFRKLSLPTQSILLRHSDKVWQWLRNTVEGSVVGRKPLPYDMEQKLCEPIALAIADDVTLHWELMDEVRREVSRTSEPFSLRSWRKRRFYRAVFSEYQRITRSSSTSQGDGIARSWDRVPLARRVPSFLRSTAGLLDIVDKSMAMSHGDSDGSLKAALLAMKYLQQCVQRYGSCCISASFHAFLLCVEGILERASWLCGKWVMRTLASGTASDDERRLVLRQVAVVISAIDMFRLPGGTPAETQATLSRRTRQNEAFLTDIALRKNIELSSSADRARISNVMAFAITGLNIFERDAGLSSFVKSTDSFEVAEIIRSLAVTMNWATSRASRSRHRAVMEKIISLVPQSHYEYRNV